MTTRTTTNKIIGQWMQFADKHGLIFTVFISIIIALVTIAGLFSLAAENYAQAAGASAFIIIVIAVIFRKNKRQK